MTPKGISFLKKEDRKNSIVIYIEANEETRKNRLLERRDADDVERRIKADEKDFNDFNDFDLIINNSEENDTRNLISLLGNLSK
jgi:dephospho-CoA kinase